LSGEPPRRFKAFGQVEHGVAEEAADGGFRRDEISGTGGVEDVFIGRLERSAS
jgi:hypothetical protein